MLDYWRRHRRRILAAAAAGAAGAAAAYYVYRRWGRGGVGDAVEPDDEAAAPLVEPRGTAATARMDAEAHLQHHFDSIQDIADNTTTPSLLPALAAALNRAADVDGLLEQLRQSKEQGPALSGPSKLALWEELKLAAFTRAVGALWLLPLLDLFVRVQLNILGRHLYLESALDSRRLGVGAPPPAVQLPRLSAASQEQFLSYAEHLARDGAAALLVQVQAAVERALRHVALQAPLDAAALGTLLSDILADFTQAAHEAGWVTFLLPSPAALADSLAARPDNRALLAPAAQQHPAAGGASSSGGAGLSQSAAQRAQQEAVDRQAVEGMLGEARRIVASDRFHDTLVACVRELSREAVGRLCERLASGPLPLAKLVPAVAAVGQDYLSPGTPSIGRLARLEQVHSLCAMVYSCGPPL